MTLSERNVFFRAAIAFCTISTLLTLAVSYLVVPAYKTIGENTRRPGDIVQFLLRHLLEPDYLAVHVSMAALVIFSLVVLFLILSFFEQTSTPEILYISFFILSFSFEIIRLVLPLHLIYTIPSFYILVSLRVLLFARYFGIFSMVAASLCAAGLEVQLTRNMIMIIIAFALVIVIGVPIDTQSWDTSMNVIYGFSSIFRVIEAAAFLAAVTSFFIASNVRGSVEYIRIGIGVMFAFIGRYFLLYFDNWAGPIPGIIMLSFGTWSACSKLHRIYLWM
jgi:hypothetical protein